MTLLALARSPALREPVAGNPFFLDAAIPTDAAGRLTFMNAVTEAMTRHGGAVSVESAQGQGSSFIVTLPLAEGGHQGAPANPRH